MQRNAEPAANVLFFARCPPTLPYEELLQLFSQYGEVKELNLYRRWAKAKNSKGCGTVTFRDKASAQAAMDGLNGKQAWPESEAMMVVEWCVPQKLQIKPESTESSVTGTKPTSKPKSVAKCSKSLPLPKLLRGDQTASQGLLQEAWTHSLFDGYSSASDQDSPLPAHLVPMMAGMIMNMPAAAQSQSKPGFSANLFMQLPNSVQQLPTASNTLLPNIAPATRDYLDDVAAALSSLQNGFGGSCNSSLTKMWSLESNPDLQQCSANPAAAVTWPVTTMQMLPNVDNIWQQQQQQAALAAAAVKGLASGLTSTRSSISGAASHSVPCNPFFNAPSMCSVMDDAHASASLFCSADYGYDHSSISGGCAGPDMCTSVPQSSAALPSLLEVIPAMSWLQLQQMELQQQQQQQSMMNASFAVANSSSPLPTVPEQYIAMTAGMASAAVHAAATAHQLDEVRVDLNPQSLKLIAASIDAVADVSGANVTIDASHGGLQLHVSGSAAQVEAACNCLRFVLAQGGMEGISKS